MMLRCTLFIAMSLLAEGCASANEGPVPLPMQPPSRYLLDTAEPASARLSPPSESPPPTAQDAVNAAVQQNVKELAQGDTPEVGAKMVKFPSGLGFVASGVAPYRTMENPTAEPKPSCRSRVG